MDNPVHREIVKSLNFEEERNIIQLEKYNGTSDICPGARKATFIYFIRSNFNRFDSFLFIND